MSHSTKIGCAPWFENGLSSARDVAEVRVSGTQIGGIIEQFQKILQTKTAEINDIQVLHSCCPSRFLLFSWLCGRGVCPLQRKFGAAAGKVSDKGDGEEAAASSRSSKGVLVQ